MSTVAKEIEITASVRVGGTNPLFLIGGPCVIESEEHTLHMAREIRNVCNSLGIPFIFKASFDKANRTSIESYRGPGMDKGLAILRSVREELDIPILSDIHETGQVHTASEVLDMIQIPAFLCRQTDLLVEAAKTRKPLNIKKGQFLSPYEVKNIIDKVKSQGNEKILLTERGTSFGYNNLIFDIRSIPIMKRLGYPVVIDATHSVQRPGGEGTSSGGEAEFIPHVARAGVSVGADGLFLEIHDNPSQALSDSFNSFNLSNLHDFCTSLLRLKRAVDEP